jgi:hypothetical protein
MSPLTWPQDPGKPGHARPDLALQRRRVHRPHGREAGLPGDPRLVGQEDRSAKNKHGEQAFRDMVKWVRDGGGIAITPDGPRGPAEHMEKGTPSLARMTGAPVIFVGLAAKPCIRLAKGSGTTP